MGELMKQTKITTFAEASKVSPTVLKPTFDQTLLKDRVNVKTLHVLGKIKLNRANFIENGKLLINFPNRESETKVKKSLEITFSDNFCFDSLLRKLDPCILRFFTKPILAPNRYLLAKKIRQLNLCDSSTVAPN